MDVQRLRASRTPLALVGMVVRSVAIPQSCSVRETMSNGQQRRQNRATAEDLCRKLPATRTCPNCKQPTPDGHFVPPSFGDRGFFVCSIANAYQASEKAK